MTTQTDMTSAIVTGFGAGCFQQWCKIRGVARGYLPTSAIEVGDLKWALNQLKAAGIHLVKDEAKLKSKDINYIKNILQYVHIQEIEREVVVASR